MQFAAQILIIFSVKKEEKAHKNEKNLHRIYTTPWSQPAFGVVPQLW